MKRVQQYLSFTYHYTCEDMDKLRKIYDKLDTLIDKYYKDECDRDYRIQMLTKSRNTTRELADLLEKNAGRPSGPLSRRDPYYSWLPTVSALRKTIGSFGLVIMLFTRHCPMFATIINLPPEEKPYRETNRKIRLLLGVDDEIHGTHIKTSDPKALWEKLKVLRYIPP